jgi:hypothetical protein
MEDVCSLLCLAIHSLIGLEKSEDVLCSQIGDHPQEYSSKDQMKKNEEFKNPFTYYLATSQNLL